MMIYLLKFSACLAIFMLFYKLFLEKENMHQLKRYYLLVAIFIALSIPLITFTTYVEPIVSNITEFQSSPKFSSQKESVEQPINYIPVILWSIYGLGVLVFGINFILNLSKIVSKIRRNPKYKMQNFTHVLLCDLIVPHTFFSYIFLNKQKFESHQIPKEVFIHEEAHAKQKHSIDILLIELLQILFWFNPLIYLTKYSIKMNHEFLADEAVLKQGIELSLYQQLLLTFSSPDNNRDVVEPELTNAINYSSIKKRFTVMKTHTSKQKIWLRSFLLLPLVALTLYGFSQTKFVKRVQISSEQNESIGIEIKPVLEINKNLDSLKLNGQHTSLLNLKEDFIKLTENENSDLIIKSDEKIDMSVVNEILFALDGHISKLILESKNVIKSIHLVNETATKLQSSDLYIDENGELLSYDKHSQQKATPEEVAEYNKLAKHCNSQLESEHPIIKTKDISRIAELYVKMSVKQKKNAEPYPNFPPPPPPPSPETGFIEVNGETLFYVKFIPTEYYNKKGYKVDKNGKTINGNKQVNASDVLPGQYITKVYQNDKVVVEFKDNGAENIPPPPPPAVPNSPKLMKGKDMPPPPPPPAPISPLEHIKEMAKKGAMFYYEGKAISSDDAINLIKKNGELNISTTQSNSNPIKVIITKDPITIKK